MKENIILQGILQSFQYTSNGRIYDIKDYQKAFEYYNRIFVYERRKKIAEKILKNCE